MSNFKTGWIPFEDRTPEQNEAHERIVSSMPEFKITGSAKTTDEKKIVLTEVWKHPEVVDSIGFVFPGIRQTSGSCVGAAGGNVIFTLSAIEVARLGDREKIIVPWWPLTYGKSRQKGGLRGRGEGSFGSSFAAAARDDGFLPSDVSGLPKFNDDDGLSLDESIEIAWSDGAAIPEKYLNISRKHPVKTTSLCKSADDVRESVRNFYPVTKAYGGFIGRGYVRGTGEGKHVFGEIDSRGGHQTAFLGWWEHPEFGELFLYVNQWQRQVYPDDPASLARCAVWTSRKQVDRICREGEVFAFSQFDGFPAQELDRSLFKITGS